MKISYVAGFRHSWSTEAYVTHAFEQHGASVKRCDIFSRSRPAIGECDAVLFTKQTSRWTQSIISECSYRGIPTATWLWDIFFGYRSDRPRQLRADLLFSTDGGHDDHYAKYREGKAPHVTLRQGIHKPEHKLFPSRHRHDLAFVGSSTYQARRRLIKNLSVNYRSRFVMISSTRGLELNKRLAQCKVVVGDSYPSPNYWSNRIYEMLGRGAFLMFPEIPGLESEFTAGEHYVPISRVWDEAKDQIDYWLDSARARDREDIRRAGFAQCGKYTYEDRVSVLLDSIKEFVDGSRNRAKGNTV